MPRAVVCGGAGFVGSHVATSFHAAGWRVTVIDGLFEHTNGRREHLAPILDDIEFVACPIEDVPGLAEIIGGADAVVDAMGWTRHVMALENPRYDLRLNLEPQVHLAQLLRAAPPRVLIYLGSRHQYGVVADDVITEDTPLVPRDVQSIHKSAADHHYRLASELTGVPVVSLRFGNTFGPHQPTLGQDVGLVAGFMRDLAQGRTIEVYGDARRRNCVYVSDVADVVLRLACRSHAGYVPCNLPGYDVTVVELAEAIRAALGRGTIEVLPRRVTATPFEVGSARFGGGRLSALLGDYPVTAFDRALATTAAWVRSQL